MFVIFWEKNKKIMNYWSVYFHLQIYIHKPAHGSGINRTPLKMEVPPGSSPTRIFFFEEKLDT